MVEALTFWTTGPGQGEVRATQLAPLSAGEALVRTRYSGISRGTESLVFRGGVPESEWQRMRAPFQRGEFPFPVAYGYAAVGVVEEGEPGWLGRRVFVLHPHQDRFVVPIHALHEVPAGVPDERAILAANLETAVNALWDAPVRVGDRVVVVGGGVVGMATALLASRHPGVAVVVVDVDPAKAGPASALGLTLQRPGEAEPGADLVIHASASPAGLAEALRLAGPEATVLELSWYGAGDVPVPLGGAFHSQRLTIRSSQVGRLAPDRRSRWSTGRRLDLALRLLAEPLFDRLLEPAEPFERLPEVMVRLAGGSTGIMCQTIRYRQPHG